MRRQFLLRVGIPVLVALVAASAWGDEKKGSPNTSASGNANLEALIAAAQKEGELNLYSVEDPSVASVLVPGFKAKYGIKVNNLRLSSGPMIERFAAEQTAGTYNSDVLVVASPEIFQQKSDWFVNADEKVVPAWSQYPEKMRGPNWAIVTIVPATIQWNSALVPADKEPKSWKDMLDPFWKGHILLTDPRSSPTYMGWAQEMQKLYGIEYLQKLAKQDFTLVQSGAPGAQQVAAGSAWVNFPASTTHASALLRKGAPIKRVVLEDGQTGPPQYASVVAKAPHPNAARLFMYYRMSPELQQEVCKTNDISSAWPESKVSGCVPLPDTWHMWDLSSWSDNAIRRPLLDALGLN